MSGQLILIWHGENLSVFTLTVCQVWVLPNASQASFISQSSVTSESLLGFQKILSLFETVHFSSCEKLTSYIFLILSDINLLSKQCQNPLITHKTLIILGLSDHVEFIYSDTFIFKDSETDQERCLNCHLTQLISGQSKIRN